MARRTRAGDVGVARIAKRGRSSGILIIVAGEVEMNHLREIHDPVREDDDGANRPELRPKRARLLSVEPPAASIARTRPGSSPEAWRRNHTRSCSSVMPGSRISRSVTSGSFRKTRNHRLLWVACGLAGFVSCQLNSLDQGAPAGSVGSKGASMRPKMCLTTHALAHPQDVCVLCRP
jgi:hypothetical protein